MEMSNLSYWFWPALSFLLAILWLRTLLRQRRAAPTIRTSATGWTHRPVEAEDALKAAYTLQEAEGTWDDEELARSLGLPARLAREVAETLVASGWAEGNIEDSMRLTEAGERRACELIRAHRLWERYLVDREGMPLEAVHAEAHRREHETTPEELDRHTRPGILTDTPSRLRAAGYLHRRAAPCWKKGLRRDGYALSAWTTNRRRYWPNWR